MKTYIYTLSHPITNEVKYVGKTVNPKQRKHNHTNTARDKGTYKRNWINKLKKEGLKPLFDIVDEVDDNWKFWERYWISQFRTWGFSLCNHTMGGEGLETGNQTSFKKGQVSWNKGTGKIKILKGTQHLNGIRTRFRKGDKPWNLGSNGYCLSGLKKAKQVEQYELNGTYIRTYLSAIQASRSLGCTSEIIRRCCLGKTQKAKGFIFKYKEHDTTK